MILWACQTRSSYYCHLQDIDYLLQKGNPHEAWNKLEKTDISGVTTEIDKAYYSSFGFRFQAV